MIYQLKTASWPISFSEQAAVYIIESLDEHGFFNLEKERPFPYPESEIASALSVVQQLEPEGVGLSGSLDYIRLQLKARGEQEALWLLTQKPELLMRKDARKLKLRPDELDKQLAVIRSCRLYPCQLGSVQQTFIQPDVRVELKDGALSIEPLAPSCAVERPTGPLSPELKRYLKEAQLTLDLLNQRTLTLMLVFHKLTEIQAESFLRGEPLKPCRLQDIAAAAGLHVSTVSRTCMDKYYEWEGQLHPFSGLLCRHIHGVSYDRLHRLLDAFIRQENPSAPWDDQQLAELLQTQDINISRRAVADLRKKWKIPNSYQRCR